MKTSVAQSVNSNRLFVEKYAKNTEDNPWNAYYERPGTMSLLPDISGKTVLDFGCGTGIVSELLIMRGADVVSLDNDAQMIKRARERLGKRGDVLLFDLNNTFKLFPDSTFDLIYSSMVIHRVKDLNQLFSEYSRILKPGGVLIFSANHPELPDSRQYPVSGYAKQGDFWKGYQAYNLYTNRPWSKITNTLSENHFNVDSIISPKPTEECRHKYPEEYNRLKNHPHFISIRAIR